MNSYLGVVDNEVICNLERYLVGVARDYYSLMENFKINGIFDISIKKITSRQFFIEFKDMEVRNTMEQHNWLWLREWFVEIEHWSIYSYAKFRIVIPIKYVLRLNMNNARGLEVRSQPKGQITACLTWTMITSLLMSCLLT
ncbi:hypothetical protein REPUB_Repub09cG0040800 [Reevesia pubescens]